jgi:hypothetical protein
MSRIKLERDDWKRYFDEVSRHLHGRHVEIKVAGLEVGEQTEADWALLQGLTYDTRDDYIEVAIEPLHHRIPHPRAVTIDVVGAELASLHVEDGDGHEQFLRFKSPLALPLP